MNHHIVCIERHCCNKLRAKHSTTLNEAKKVITYLRNKSTYISCVLKLMYLRLCVVCKEEDRWRPADENSSRAAPILFSLTPDQLEEIFLGATALTTT
jgi:hypothetical protein